MYIQTIDHKFIALPHLNREDSRKSHNIHAQKNKYQKHTVSKECNTQRATGGLKTQCRHIIPALAYYATRLPQNTDNHTVRITNTPRRQNHHQPHKTRLFPSQTSNQKSLAPAQRRTKKTSIYEPLYSGGQSPSPPTTGTGRHPNATARKRVRPRHTQLT